MLTNIVLLKVAVIGKAAEGRALRSMALKKYGTPRYRLQRLAQGVGSEAREFQVAYAYLRGKTPGFYESSTTRKVINAKAVTAIIERYWTPPLQEKGEVWRAWKKRQESIKAEFLALVTTDLQAWNHCARVGTCGTFRQDPGNIERAKAIKNLARMQGRTAEEPGAEKAA